MTHKTYEIISTNQISSLNDIHSIVTHTLEVLEPSYSKTIDKTYFPNFKLISKDFNRIKIGIKDSSVENPFKFEYSFIKGSKRTINIVAVFKCENVEEYNFELHNLISITGIISYSKHTSKQNLISNKRVVFWDNEKKPQQDKVSLSKFFLDSCGVEIMFEKTATNKKPRFWPIYSDFNLDSNNKKRFKDLFGCDFIGKVVDKQKVNSLCYSSVGRAKSYGFGGLTVNLHE